MRNRISPLGLLGRWKLLLGGVSVFALYAANGVEPVLVADFEADTYGNSTFDAMFDTTVTGISTMTDSADGNLKWAPHNLALQSATPATQSITVVSGSDYTVEITGTGSVTLSGAGTGSVTAGSPVEVTASTTTLTLTVVGSPTTMWAYRSDLGGMANNPDTGDSYVPTTTAAVYLPRRKAQITESGVDYTRLITEPTAATNYCPNSTPGTGWSATRASWDTGTLAESSTGVADLPLLVEDSTASNSHIGNEITSASGVSVPVCLSFEVAEPASNSRRYAQIRLYDNPAQVGGAGFFGFYDIVYDAQTQTITSTGSGGTVADTDSGVIELPNGKKRIWMCLTKQGGAVRTDMAIYLSPVSTYSGNPIYTGDGVSGLHFGNVQVEETLYPTSYIPTNGSTVTRAAQALEVKSSVVTSLWPAWGDPIGAELVTNGTFDTDTTGWTGANSAVLSVVSNTLQVENGAASFGYAYTPMTTVVGSVYRITASTTGASWLLRVGDDPAAGTNQKVALSGGAPADITEYFVATATTTYIRVGLNNSTLGFQATFDNISVREVNPLAISMKLSGNMTYADEDETSEREFVRIYGDANNSIRLSLSTGGALPASTGGPDAVQRESAVTDRFYQANVWSPGVNVPFSAASYHKSNEVNVAAEGTASAGDATPVALADLSAVPIQLAYFGGPSALGKFVFWNTTIEAAGLTETTT